MKHPLQIGGDAALCVEEIEAAQVPCVNPAKCVTVKVTAGQAQHLSVSTAARRLTPVLESLQVVTNIGPCQVSPAFGSLSAQEATPTAAGPSLG